MSNKSSYWFKRRRYGYGWTPVTWQGWTSVGVALAIIVGAAIYLFPAKPQQPSSLQFVAFFLIVLSAIFIMIGVSLAKGPSPRWRWGKTPSDNPDEDI